MTNSTINVTVFIINSAARTFSLPTDATVSQLQAQAPELASGIFKNISNMSVEMGASDVLADGMQLTFSPTTTTASGRTETLKPKGANVEVTMTEVTIVKEARASKEYLVPTKVIVDGIETTVNAYQNLVVDGATAELFKATVPSVFTVQDVLTMAGISTARVYIDGVEVGYGRSVGSTTPITIKIEQASDTPVFTQSPSCNDCDCDDEDCC